MALFSEQLVEEYFNRQKYLTIRGARQGVGETDILAVRHTPEGVDALHIEVQTSFRPVAYLSNSNAKSRDEPTVLKEMAKWLLKKYTSPDKVALRNSVWPEVAWKYVFVHARLKDERELRFLEAEGVSLIAFDAVLRLLVKKLKKGEFSASSGGDVVEILRFYDDIKNAG